jgi:sugar O-acyltransferase (sialic acid O-acetyltransferase NeuD family)
MSKLVIFGKGLFTEIAEQYFTEQGEHEIVAYTLDDQYVTEASYLDKPLVKFSEIEKRFPPDEYSMFIAVSYTDMNRLRERIYNDAKNKGYKLVSYISPEATIKTKYPIGDNCFIFEDNTIQPFVSIGDNVIIWSGNHIGHHSTIKNHNFISSHVVVSGQCCIESNCFLGVNASIGHGVTVRRGTLVGAGASITKDTEEKSVFVPARSVKLDKTSDEIKL